MFLAKSTGKPGIRRRLTVGEKQGRTKLFERSNYLVIKYLWAVEQAYNEKDYQVVGSLTAQGFQYIMPKLQAVAHINSNTAIDFLRELRAELLATRQALPPGQALPAPIEAEYKVVKTEPSESLPIESPSEVATSPSPVPKKNENEAIAVPSDKPTTVQHRRVKRVKAVAPPVIDKPFSEMTREEIVKRYKV